MRYEFIPCVLLLAAMLASCASGDPETATGALRRDSAGIEIVENHFVPGAANLWTVDDSPAVIVGLSAGAEEYLLHRVTGAVRLSDGGIVIAEYDARLRYYDSTGRHVRTSSFLGDGPGELTRIGGIFLGLSDTVVAIAGEPAGDGFNRGYAAVVDSEGRILQKRQLWWPNAMPRFTADGMHVVAWGPWVGIENMSNDGSFIARSFEWPSLEGSSGIRWVNEPYYRISADGTNVDTLMVLPARTISETPGVRFGWSTPIFSRRAPATAVHDNWLYWGSGDTFEIHVYNIAGTARPSAPARIIRYESGAEAPAESELRDQYLRVVLQSAESAGDSAFAREDIMKATFMETLPAFQRLLTDSQGNLWVEHSRLSSVAQVADGPDEQNRWSVFDSTGAFISNVTTPVGLAITQIGSAWLLGIAADENDAQQVRLHRISKATGIRG